MFFHLLLTCPQGTVELLAQELEELGISDLKFGHNRIECKNISEEDFYRIHLYVRIASHIYWVLARLQFSSVGYLRKRLSKIDWQKILRPGGQYEVLFTVDRDRRGPQSPKQIEKLLHESIAESFDSTKDKTPKPVKNARSRIIVRVSQGYLTVSMDTAGRSLHKRGYRSGDHPAPMKENLAAAVLRFAGYRRNQIFWDPMVGSGTFAIEASMISLGKAPQIHRSKGEFGFEHVYTFNRTLWRNVQDEARRNRCEKLEKPVIASDISGEFIAIARKSALKARVEKFIRFEVADFFDCDFNTEKGLVLFNLPYNVRLEFGVEEKSFYNKLSLKLKELVGWRVCMMLSAKDVPKALNRHKVLKTLQLSNGGIKILVVLLEPSDAKASTGE